jgi:uncharacterized protein DUF2490
MRFFIILALLGFSNANKVKAQSTSKFQVWSDFNPSFKLNENWKIGGDIGYRIEPSTNIQSLYVRPGVNYNPNGIINFTFGVANFNTIRVDKFNTTEFRSFQFIVLKWPNIGGFRFKHRIGLEQRIFFVESIDLNEFSHRARYFFEVKSPNFNLFDIGSPFFAMGNFELLKNVNINEIESLFDHNRYTVGLGNVISDKLRVELRYKIISFADPALKSFVKEIDVLRIRLYYQFK